MSESSNPRKHLTAKMRVYHGPSLQMVLSGYSVDMSSRGLFLKTETQFSVDEIVMLSFTLPDVDKTINCRARVAWLNRADEPCKPQMPTGVGLEFLDLNEEYLVSIQSLLKHDGVEPVSESA